MCSCQLAIGADYWSESGGERGSCYRCGAASVLFCPHAVDTETRTSSGRSLSLWTSDGVKMPSDRCDHSSLCCSRSRFHSSHPNSARVVGGILYIVPPPFHPLTARLVFFGRPSVLPSFLPSVCRCERGPEGLAWQPGISTQDPLLPPPSSQQCPAGPLGNLFTVHRPTALLLSGLLQCSSFPVPSTSQAESMLIQR